MSVFQLARPFLSVFRATYEFFAHGDLGLQRDLPEEVAVELETARRLLFIVEADLTKPASPVAFVSDASMKGFALYETQVTPAEVLELTRHRERNRFRVREKVVDRETEGFRGELAGPEATKDWFDCQLALEPRRGRGSVRVKEYALTGEAPPPLPESFVASGRWSLVVACAWRSAAKIHEYEARGELLGLRRAAHDLRCHDTVLLSASDNMSSVCAYEKGRASNWELLAQCRRAAALQAASGIVWRQRHVEGVRDVADFMSRAADRGELRPGQIRLGAVARRKTGGGLRRDVEECCHPTVRPPPEVAALEVFSGRGWLTGAWAAAGLRVGVPCDVSSGPHFDCRRDSVQQAILSWVRTGRIWLIHISPPAPSGPEPRRSRRSLSASPQLAVFAARLVRAAAAAGAHFCVEATAQSALWAWRPLLRALKEAHAFFVDFAFCQFGAPYRRDTRIATNLATLSLLGRPCLCGGHAASLGGTVRGPDGDALARSDLGGRYPAELCRVYAAAAQCVAPAGAWRKPGERLLRPQRENRLAAAAGEGPRCRVDVATVWDESNAWLAWPCARRPPGAARPGPPGLAAAAKGDGGRRLLGAGVGDGRDRRAVHAVCRGAKALREERQAEELEPRVSGEGGPGARGLLRGAVLPGRVEGSGALHLVRSGVGAVLGDPQPGLSAGEAGVEGLGSDGAGGQPRADSVRAGAQRGAEALRGHWRRDRGDAATLLCFDAYLRPSECLSLTRAHVVPPHGQGAAGQWAVTIAPAALETPSKTNTYDDTVIVGEVRGPRSYVAAVLKALYDTSSSKLFSRLTLHRFEVLIKKASLAAGLGDSYVPHQCRHGGASHDALYSVRSMRDIQRRGRWRARESVRRYEKHGILLRVRRRTPLTVLTAAAASAPKTVGLMAQAIRASRGGVSEQRMPLALKRTRGRMGRSDCLRS